MNMVQYKKLKVGDRVQNLTPVASYYHGEIAKAVWTIEQLNCPSVRRNRITFAMVRMVENPQVQTAVVSDGLKIWGFA